MAGPKLTLTTEVDSTSSQRGLDDFKQKVKQTEKESADAFSTMQEKIEGVAGSLGAINPVLGEQAEKVSGLIQGFQGIVKMLGNIAPQLFNTSKAIGDLDTKFKSVKSTVGTLPAVVGDLAKGINVVGANGISVNVPALVNGKESDDKKGEGDDSKDEMQGDRSEKQTLGMEEISKEKELLEMKNKEIEYTKKRINGLEKLVVAKDAGEAVSGGESMAGLSVLKTPLAMSGIAVAAANVALYGEAIKDASEKTHELIEETRHLDVGTDELQDLLAVTKRLGMENEEVVATMSHLRRSVAEAAEGNKEYTKAFDALGVSQKQITADGGNVVQITNDIRKSFSGLNEDQQKALEANIYKVFGKDAAGMIEVLKQTNEETDKITSSVTKLSPIAVDSFHKVAVETNSLKQSFSNLWTSFENGIGVSLALGTKFIQSDFFKYIYKHSDLGAVGSFAKYIGNNYATAASMILPKSLTVDSTASNDDGASSSAGDEGATGEASKETPGKAYDENLKALNAKAENDQVAAMSPADRIAFHRARANQLAGGSLPFGYEGMNSEDKIAAIQSSTGLDSDKASDRAKQIEESMDEANKTQRELDKAFSEGQKKLNSTKAEKGFNQSAAGYSYDKSDTDALARFGELANAAKGNNSIEAYTENIERQTELIGKMVEKRNKYMEALKTAKAKGAELTEASSRDKEQDALDAADTPQKKGVVLAQQQKSIQDQIKAESTNVPKTELEYQNQKNAALELQGKLEKINGDIAKNNLEIKKEEAEKAKDAKEKANEHARRHAEEQASLGRSMSLTPGLVHRTHSGGQQHYRMYSAGHELGQSIHASVQPKTNDAASQGASLMQRQIQIAENILTQIKMIQQGSSGTGDGAFAG